MKVFIAKNKTLGDKEAFKIVKRQLLKKPGSLLGLAVGQTTDDLYKLISKDVIKNTKVWSRVKILQIDETIGVKPDSPISFNLEIRKELKALINILPEKSIFLMNGTKSPKAIAKEAYSFIKRHKGIDLIILGLGPEYDPHIAYNTCGRSSLNSRIRAVTLHPKTREKLMKKSKVRKQRKNQFLKGITLGIRDILDAKKVLLIAYGKEKSKSVQLVTSGKMNLKKASASALVVHKNFDIVIDRDAAKLMDNYQLQ